MIAFWMLWAVTVTAILGLAAHVAESTLRHASRPTRWPWLAALAGSLSLQAWSLLRPTPAPVTPAPGSGAPWSALDLAWLLDLRARAEASAPMLAERLDAALTMGWAVTATALTATLVGGLLLLRARAAGWRHARVEGEDVLVSGDFGPALVGVWSPRIVLPRWALRLPPEDLRLAFRHEAEHRAARDTWVLFAGALAVSLSPWNAALWWHLARLRTAVEVDCDTRVLRAGASRRAYGALLLEIGSGRSRDRLPVLALAKPRSLLERRLTMIVNDVHPKRPLRSIAAAAAVLALVVAACETPAPTTPAGEEPAIAEPRVTPMDAESPVERLGELQRGDPKVFVDGVETSESVLRSLIPEGIERVEILKGPAATGLYGPEAAGGVINIFTKRDPDESSMDIGGVLTPR